MRFQVLGAGVLLLAGSALAQSDEFEAEEPGFGGEATSGAVQTEEPGGNPVLGETHEVRSGDTLWDLSTRYLNTPWYWPKVWSYNPQLTNPHWIFPGNEVRFYPGDENLPTAVDVASNDLDIGDNDLIIPGQLADDELVQTVGEIKSAGMTGQSYWAAFAGFMDRGASRLTGRIENSFSERYQLDDYDKIYLKMRESVEPGAQLAVYRRERQVNHPVTGANLGYMVTMVGRAEVTENSPSMTSGVVTRAFRPIYRGDFVGPLPEYFGQRVTPVANQSEAQGYVVDTVKDLITLIGEHHIVLIDQGRADGLQIGNVLTVLTQGDGYTGKREGLPYEPIGEVLVIDVQETGSTAVVTSSLRSITVGDRIAMRVE